MRIKTDYQPVSASVGDLIASNNGGIYSDDLNCKQIVGIVMSVEEVEIDDDYIETLYRVHTSYGIEEWWANEIWILEK